MKRLIPVAAVLTLAGQVFAEPAAPAVEAGVEEIRVEGAFVASPFELRRDNVVREMVSRMSERAEAARAAELQKANESSVTRLLDLTRFIPIPLGSSENRVDSFFLQNYMRRDLKPRDEDRLSLSLSR